MHVGQRVRFACTFSIAGASTDPTSVTLKVRKPSGTTITVADADLTVGTPGVYAYELVVDQAGTWRWQWSGTGAVGAVDAGEFRAERTI